MSLKKEIIEDSKAFVRTNRRLLIDFEERASQGYLSPRISSEFMDCSLPMTFDSYSHCSLGCMYCCLEGTKIATPDGQKTIEDIKIGDTIYSRNILTGKIILDQVLSVMERNVNEILQITTEDGTILTITKEHPVYVKGYGWKKAGELKEEDELDVSKRPDQSYRFQKSNPMSNPDVAKKQSTTLKERFASGELENLRKKLTISGKKNLRKYNKSIRGRKKVAIRMKKQNPMSNPDVAKKQSTTLKEGYSTGRIIPPWKGKKKPDATHRMLTNNPMKDPKIRKKTLQKIVKSWERNGKISEGEIKVYNVLREIKTNFIHQFVVVGPNRNYILDFMLPEISTCIEYDGHSKHYTKKGMQNDHKRDRWILKNLGIKTIRIHRDQAFIPPGELQNFIRGEITI